MFTIQKFDSVESTMDIAREKACDKNAEGLFIQAMEQKGGRGRHGNAWSSPIGNLYQSFILHPKTPMHQWGQLSFVIAVSLFKACEQAGIPKHDIDLKWPNDVLIKGQKIAGILIETGEDYVIVGTGVNIELAPDDRAKIRDYAPDMSVDEFRDIFLSHIETYYKLWEKEGFEPIRKIWMSRAYMLNQPIKARLPNITYEGIFDDFDHTGTLILREKDGSLRKITSGEILNATRD